MKKNILKKVIALTYLAFILVGFTIPIHFSLAVCVPTPGGQACTDLPNFNYKLLAPLPCAEGTPGCVNGQLKNFDPTQPNNFGTYLNLMIKLFIGICAVLAVVMIVMGGMQYMTSELISSKAAGKERIINAILGLLLALGAYTLLFTINPDLLNIDLSGVTQQVVTVDLQSDVPQPAPPAGGKFTCGVGPNDPISKMGEITTLPDWVTRNFPECTTVGQGSGCLSTRGLSLSSLIEVHNKCPNINLQLNGATECWQHGGTTHGTTHGPGNATVDIAQNTQLNNCLSGGQKLEYYHRYGPGNQYLWETNHWHIGR